MGNEQYSRRQARRDAGEKVMSEVNEGTIVLKTGMIVERHIGTLGLVLVVDNGIAIAWTEHTGSLGLTTISGFDYFYSDSDLLSPKAGSIHKSSYVKAVYEGVTGGHNAYRVQIDRNHLGKKIWSEDTVELTLKEVADKFGISVEQLRIKDAKA